MGIRRTLKQKKEAEVHRELTYHWNSSLQVPMASSVAASKNEVKSPEPAKLQFDLMGYPLSMIYRDIFKTIALVVLMISTLVALKIMKM